MVDFSRRSDEKEMIDSPHLLQPGEMEQTLRELNLVNRWLGGAEAVLGPARAELSRLHSASPPGRSFRVLDVGAGGGDIPRRLLQWARRRGIPLSIMAVDFNPQANVIAARSAPSDSIRFVTADVLALPFAPKAFDLVLCSAFLHHFPEEAAARVLRALRTAAGQAVLVNDLHRHPFAYWSFRLLSGLLSRSRAIRHDGPLSILRGFRRRELERTFREAGFKKLQITWRWAFRWSAIGRAEDTRDSVLR
ncbi:MAG TPA: methyltransferase domain-containing protein [Acidobacteriota bacterium]|nr:methyltransferase domain-containing protein [Acidobacteriota bacterium]